MGYENQIILLSDNIFQMAFVYNFIFHQVGILMWCDFLLIWSPIFFLIVWMSGMLFLTFDLTMFIFFCIANNLWNLWFIALERGDLMAVIWEHQRIITKNLWLLLVKWISIWIYFTSIKFFHFEMDPFKYWKDFDGFRSPSVC